MSSVLSVLFPMKRLQGCLTTASDLFQAYVYTAAINLSDVFKNYVKLGCFNQTNVNLLVQQKLNMNGLVNTDTG